MHFEKGQKVTVLLRDEPFSVEEVVDVLSAGDLLLSSGRIFDKHGRSKSGDLWQCAYIEPYALGDEKLI